METELVRNAGNIDDSLRAVSTAIQFGAGTASSGDLLPTGNKIWEEATLLAMRGRIMPEFVAGLRNHVQGDALAFAEAKLRAFQGHALQSNTRSITEGVEAASQLARQGVTAILVKGPFQQFQTYGTFFHRPSSDTDILVKPSEFSTATRILLAAGFQTVNESQFNYWDVFVGERHLRRDRNAFWSIDLHQRLQAPGCRQPRNSEMWVDDAETLDVAGRPVRVLSSLDVPILLAMSIVKALRRKEIAIKHVCDFYVSAVPSLDKVLRRSQKYGLERTVGIAVEAVRAVYGPQACASVLDGAVFDISSEQMLRMLMLGEDANVPVPHSAWLRTECGTDWLQYARDSLWYQGAEIARKMERVARLGLGKRKTADIGR